MLNNVAIGAKYALLTAGYDRIAIFDYSIYQGCGTQDIVQGAWYLKLCLTYRVRVRLGTL